MSTFKLLELLLFKYVQKLQKIKYNRYIYFSLCIAIYFHPLAIVAKVSDMAYGPFVIYCAIRCTEGSKF